jgi:hypothetical protein
MAEKTRKVMEDLSSGNIFEIKLNEEQMGKYEEINRRYGEAVGKKLDASDKEYWASLRKLRREGFIINY